MNQQNLGKNNPRIHWNMHVKASKIHNVHEEVPWSFPSIHIVTTRFMQGQANLIELTKARFELFKAICFPSMVGQDVMREYFSKLNDSQSENGNIDPPFLWIIKIDPNLDKLTLKNMIALTRPFSNFFLVANSIDDPIGRWRNNLTVEKLLSSQVYSGDIRILQKALNLRNDFISLETRLDSDDALQHAFLKEVQRYAVNSLNTRNQLEIGRRDTKKYKRADWLAWCTL
jgi:hypothetical protein